MSIDDLKIIKQIGKGAFSDVFLTLIKNENMFYTTKIIEKKNI